MVFLFLPKNRIESIFFPVRRPPLGYEQLWFSDLTGTSTQSLLLCWIHSECRVIAPHPSGTGSKGIDPRSLSDRISHCHISYWY
jgi:hypothetical protein